MYIYGGALLPNERITNELWKFDFNTLVWSEIESPCGQYGNESCYCPIGVKDHSANVVNNTMYVFFGYSTLDYIINIVQEFDLGKRDT